MDGASRGWEIKVKLRMGLLKVEGVYGIVEQVVLSSTLSSSIMWIMDLCDGHA